MTWSRWRRLLVIAAALLIAASCTNSERKYGPVTYVAVGASDTVGVGTQFPERDAWPARLNTRLPDGSELIRLGVSGSLTKQAISEQLSKAEEAEADIATVWLAVNDFNGLVPVDEYEKDLTTLLTRLTESGARVFVGNVPDLTKVPIYERVPPEILSKRVEDWNVAIARATKKSKSVLVDLFPASQKLADRGHSLISPDGFHPSEEGYALIADVFWARIKSDSVIGSAVVRKAS